MKHPFPFAPCLLLLLFLAGSAPFEKLLAQQTLQVVTQRIRKSLAHPAGSSLKVNAQRAEIHINAWDVDSIRLELRLIAKHPDRATAAQDLKTMTYYMDRVGDKLEIRNFFSAPSNTPPPVSNLKAVYFLWIPATCAVAIDNSFGTVEIRGLRAPVNVSGQYCEMAFYDYAGQMKLNTYFGDIRGEGLAGKAEMRIDRADLFLSGLASALTVQARYAGIRLDLAGSEAGIRVDAEKSDLQLTGVVPARHRFVLRTQNGEIVAPERLGLAYGQNRQRADFGDARATHLVDLSTTFGTISVE